MTWFVFGASGCGEKEERPVAAEQPAMQEAPADSVEDQLAQLREELRRLRESRGGETAATPVGDDRMDDYKNQVELETQRRVQLSANYVNEAKAHQQAGDLPKAWEMARDAVDLDPTNAEAFRMYNELSDLLGKRPGQINETMNKVSEEERAKRMQAKLEIERRYNKGLELYGQEEYDKAIDQFNSALELIKVQAYSLDVSGLETQLENAIRLADQKKREHETNLELERKRAAHYLEQVKSAQAAENLKQRVNRLYHEATRAFEVGDYEKSEKIANLILVDLPNSKEARALSEASREAYFAAKMNANIENRIKEWRQSFMSMDEIAIPWADIIRFPKRSEWDKVSARALNLSSEAESVGGSELETRVIARLQEVNMDRWTATSSQTLEEIFSTLGEVAGISMVLNLGEDSEVDTTAPNLSLQNVSVHTILKTVLKLRDLVMDIDGSVDSPIIYLVPSGHAGGETYIRIYDVTDLSTPIRDFPGPEILLTDSGASPEDPGAASEPVVISGDEVVEIIQTYVQPTSWEDENVFIQSRPGGQLIVKHNRRAHQEIEKLLSHVRQTGGILIHVETRFLTVNDDFLDDLGISYTGIGTGADALAFSPTAWNVTGGNAVDHVIGSNRDPGLIYNLGSDGFLRNRLENILNFPFNTPAVANGLTNSGGIGINFNFLDDIQLSAMMNLVEKTQRASNVNTARITLFNSQRANIVVSRNNSVIPDYEVQVATSRSIADPVPQILREGIFLDVRPTVSPDKKFVTLDLRPTIASLRRPILTRIVRLSEDATVPLQLPELEIQQVRTTTKVPDGGIVLMGGQSTTSDVDETAGTPWISEIPVLNFFFQRKAKTKVRTNTIILVKTTIIDMMEEEMRQMSSGR